MSYSWGVGTPTTPPAGGPAPTPHDARATDGPAPDPTPPPAPAGCGVLDSGAERDLGRLVAELTPRVEVWRRLIDRHRPDPAGRCRTCVKGGVASRPTLWPCSVRGVAELARRRHEAQTA